MIARSVNRDFTNTGLSSRIDVELNSERCKKTGVASMYVRSVLENTMEDKDGLILLCLLGRCLTWTGLVNSSTDESRSSEYSQVHDKNHVAVRLGAIAQALNFKASFQGPPQSIA